MTKKTYKKYAWVIVAALILIGFFYGFLSGAYRYWPYEILQTNYKKFISNEYDLIYEEIDPLYEKTDVSALVKIKNENDILGKRKKLIQYIWKGKGFPKSFFPKEIESGIEDNKYLDLGNLKTIDKLTIQMDHDINSISYHFQPIKRNNNLVIYHQGHLGDFILGKKTIQFFLQEGYDVIALSMPLVGMNNKPIVELPSFGTVKLSSHNHLKLLETKSFSPISIFLGPVAASVNYVVKKFEFDSISMVGISGGGWTTTLYSAIDTRIDKSYPVSGTVPIYLRSLRDLGDYEQVEPEIYRIANYPELYIMGGYGTGRSQVQIVNKFDDCCFAGINYQTYEDEVKAALAELEGNFRVYLDETHKEHKISVNALNAIKEDLET